MNGFSNFFFYKPCHDIPLSFDICHTSLLRPVRAWLRYNGDLFVFFLFFSILWRVCARCPSPVYTNFFRSFLVEWATRGKKNFENPLRIGPLAVDFVEEVQKSVNCTCFYSCLDPCWIFGLLSGTHFGPFFCLFFCPSFYFCWDLGWFCWFPLISTHLFQLPYFNHPLI